MKKKYPGEEQTSTEHPCQSLEQKSARTVPHNSQKDPTICYMATDSI